MYMVKTLNIYFFPSFKNSTFIPCHKVQISFLACTFRARSQRHLGVYWKVQSLLKISWLKWIQSLTFSSSIALFSFYPSASCSNTLQQSWKKMSSLVFGVQRGEKVHLESCAGLWKVKMSQVLRTHQWVRKCSPFEELGCFWFASSLTSSLISVAPPIQEIIERMVRPPCDMRVMDLCMFPPSISKSAVAWL